MDQQLDPPRPNETKTRWRDGLGTHQLRRFREFQNRLTSNDGHLTPSQRLKKERIQINWLLIFLKIGERGEVRLGGVRVKLRRERGRESDRGESE